MTHRGWCRDRRKQCGAGVSRRRIALLVLVLSLATGCQQAPTGPSPREQAALARELALLEKARAVPSPVAVEITARRIIERFPATGQAAALRKEWPSLQAEAERWREQRRREELWRYTAAEHSQGFQLMAELDGVPPEGAPPLRLVLRRHPRLGQGAYLLIDRSADFACEHECTLQMAFDDAPARGMGVRRALDNVPPALFLREHGAFYAALEDAGQLRVDVPLASGRRATYAFDIGGYQPERMQGDGSRTRTGG